MSQTRGDPALSASEMPGQCVAWIIDPLQYTTALDRLRKSRRCAFAGTACETTKAKAIDTIACPLLRANFVADRGWYFRRHRQAGFKLCTAPANGEATRFAKPAPRKW